ncbi:MAG TPA: helix-hairpin-helix domain-containing protein [Thermoanaerobaculia bacterium]
MKQSYRAVAALLFLTTLLGALPAQAAADGKKVNINSADSSQLTMLPRVGPSVAQRIVDYRKQNGSFKKPEDLMLVRGIGEKTFELIKPYVAVAGETTLHEKVHGSRSAAGKESPGKSKESPGKGKKKEAPAKDGKDAR